MSKNWYIYAALAFLTSAGISCASHRPETEATLSESEKTVRRAEEIRRDIASGGLSISQVIPFAPIARLRAQIELALSRNLQHRGEAHITVITPIEYEHLKAVLDINAINALATRAGLQGAEYFVRCVGRGESKSAGMATYYVVVEAPALVKIRQLIRDEAQRILASQSASLQKKLKPGLDRFDPTRFYPHITIGFTDRDLHESDGIIKDQSSCWSKLEVKSR
jgi:hypothetical protein